MSPSVEAISVVTAVAVGVVVLAALLIITFKLCWVNKRRSRRLSSSLREYMHQAAKVQRVSIHSFTKTVKDEPQYVFQNELNLQANSLTIQSSHKTKRYSEPYLTENKIKDQLDLSRPHSDTDVQVIKSASHLQDRPDDLMTSFCGRSNMSIIHERHNTPITKTEKVTEHVPSKTKCLADEIPVWSMDSVEYGKNSFSETTEDSYM